MEPTATITIVTTTHKIVVSAAHVLRAEGVVPRFDVSVGSAKSTETVNAVSSAQAAEFIERESGETHHTALRLVANAADMAEFTNTLASSHNLVEFPSLR